MSKLSLSIDSHRVEILMDSTELKGDLNQLWASKLKPAFGALRNVTHPEWFEERFPELAISKVDGK